MREYITARLAEMRGSEDKTLLADVLGEVFLAMSDETERNDGLSPRRTRIAFNER